jgi:hypothetical protein
VKLKQEVKANAAESLNAKRVEQEPIDSLVAAQTNSGSEQVDPKLDDGSNIVLVLYHRR